ncbi:hypothetical protein FF100_35130 [Methylobacterium terricola]|uniref:Uncharacterized protein n=1 Tax=Methylobacterium terricola TaxID=2583531 RepID=A0A5C4L7Y3_9HYPH|nr:hypothetical protein [Methylobacterium terricola]TNC05955.1 hypothetical protein FF100_35130 [Methylobacterium terricola]
MSDLDHAVSDRSCVRRGGAPLDSGPASDADELSLAELDGVDGGLLSPFLIWMIGNAFRSRGYWV